MGLLVLGRKHGNDGGGKRYRSDVPVEDDDEVEGMLAKAEEKARRSCQGRTENTLGPKLEFLQMRYGGEESLEVRRFRSFVLELNRPTGMRMSSQGQGQGWLSLGEKTKDRRTVVH